MIDTRQDSMTKGYKGLLILAVVWLLVAGLFFMTESAAVATPPIKNLALRMLHYYDSVSPCTHCNES